MVPCAPLPTRTHPLRLTCPRCGGTGFVYSCEPSCCFNHVCVGCRAAFQTATVALGGTLRDAAPPDPLPDCTEPAAPCCECRSVAVYRLDDGRCVCTDCGALLRIELGDEPA